MIDHRSTILNFNSIQGATWTDEEAGILSNLSSMIQQQRDIEKVANNDSFVNPLERKNTEITPVQTFRPNSKFPEDFSRKKYNIDLTPSFASLSVLSNPIVNAKQETEDVSYLYFLMTFSHAIHAEQNILKPE